MSEISVRKQLIVGLPQTGKTTFLAALWHVVTSDEVTVGLRLKELFGDDEYLNKIRRQWLSYQKVDRTNLNSEQIVRMRLQDPENDRTTDVVFPDLSGETFRQQWELRQWTFDYVNFVREASGALLFLHPNRVGRNLPIVDITPAFAVLDDIVPRQRDSNGGPSDISLDSLTNGWDPKSTSTQTQLVELLQFILNEELATYPFRVAVIISAWDEVKHMQMAPNQWLKTELPLLDQYLAANAETFEHRIYGVSAQGGDLGKDYNSLTKIPQASERIEVVDQDIMSHDLTIPVKWVMR